MKYLKKSLMVFMPLLLALGTLKYYISTPHFKSTLTRILKTNALNVEFDKIRLYGFDRIQIDNLKVRDLSGNMVIDAKKVVAKINLLTPTRLSKIDIFGATVNLERRKNNDFNLFHIIKDKKEKTFDRTSRIGKLFIHNAVLNYADTSFKEKIQKSMTSVNGNLESAKSRGFLLVAKGIGNLNADNTVETLGIELNQKLNSVQSLKSRFDKIKNSSEKRKEFYLNFDFGNVKVTKELGQYLPLEMITIKGGMLNGKLNLTKNKATETMEPTGNLVVKDGILNYVDFDGDIDKINANINMTKENIIVNANSLLAQKPVSLLLNYGNQNLKLTMKIKVREVPYSQIARYKTLKGFNVKAKGNVTGELNLKVDIEKSKEKDKNKNQVQKKTKEKSAKVELDGKFSSENIKIANYNFRNISTNMKLSTQKGFFELDDTAFRFDEVLSGFRIKDDVKIPKFIYDLNKKTGKGNYILVNKGSDYNIPRFVGNVKISNKNIISGTLISKKLNADYVVNPTAKTLFVNAQGKDYITVRYGGKKYVLNPDVKKLFVKFDEKHMLRSGNIKAKLKNLPIKMIESIVANININRGNYNIKASVKTGGVVVSVKGTTTADMKHSYNIKNVSKMDLSKLLKNYGYNFKGMDKARLPMDVKAKIDGTNNRIMGSYEIYSPSGEYFVKYKNLHASGKIRDLTKMDLDMNILANEVSWEDQRLKNLTAKLNMKNDILKIQSLGNDKLFAQGSYHLKTGRAEIDAKLNNYVFKSKKLNDAKFLLNAKAKISGKVNDRLSGNFEIYSPYGEYIAEFENLHAKGKINDLAKMNLDMNIFADEVWYQYHRLKNLTAKLNLKNDILKIESLGNDKLFAQGSYNLKTRNVKLDGELKNYVLYGIFDPQVSMYVDSLKANVSGTPDNLNGKILLTPSTTKINFNSIGQTRANLDIKNSIVNFKDVTLRGNNISGTYNLKNKVADLELNLDEDDIPKLLKMKDLTFGTKSKINLKGHLNKFNMYGHLILGNMSYRSYKIPHIVANIDYSNGNIDKLFKYGIFDIKSLKFIGENNETLFETNTKFDLENVDIDYKVGDHNFSLDSVQDLKNKGYSGNIDFDFFYKGSFEKFLTGLKIKSDKVTLAGFPVTNLDIDLQGNEKTVNIGLFNLNYENNPLIVSGYFDYSPIKYDISVLAQNFNLNFLEANKDVASASGIANIDAILSSSHGTSGHILLNNFNYKTKDERTLVDNINANIDLEGTKLIVNRLDGGFNNGTFNVTGNLDVPTIPPDFMKTKRLQLGKFELNANLNKLGLHYGNDIDYAVTGDLMLTEDRLFGNLVVSDAEIRKIPDFVNKDNSKNSELQKQEKDKSIVEGVVEEVLDKILKQYTVNLNVQVGEKVKLNIPSVSLVKNIKGTIKGATEISFENGAIGLMGDFDISKGSFYLNGNEFKIDNSIVSLSKSTSETDFMSNTFVNFEASTKVGSERIEVSVTGNVNNPDIRFSSSSGKTEEEIISLLAFDKVVGNGSKDKKGPKDNSEDGVVVAGSLLSTALNELIFSSITDKIEGVFGLSKVSVSTNIDKSNKTGKYNASTTLSLKDKLYKDKIYWNLAIKFPFQSSGEKEENPIGYNAWLSYNIATGLDLRAGGETAPKSSKINLRASNKKQNKINYYFGIDFSTKADSIGDLFKKIFKKRKLDTLRK